MGLGAFMRLMRPFVPSTRRNLGASLSLKVHFKPGTVLTNEELFDLHNSVSAIGRQKNIDHPICSGDLDLKQLRNKYSDAVVSLIYKGPKAEAFLFSPLFEFDKGNVLHYGLAISSGKVKIKTAEMLGLGASDIMLRNGKFSYFATNVTCHPRYVELFCNTVFRPWPAPDVNLLRPPDDYVPVFKALFQKYLRHNIHRAAPNYERFTITSRSKNSGFKHDVHQVKTPKNLSFLTFCNAWLSYEKEEDLVQVGSITPFHGLAASLKLEVMCLLSRMKMKTSGSTSRGLERKWGTVPGKLSLKGATTLSVSSSGSTEQSDKLSDGGTRKYCSGVPRGLDYSRNWLFIDEQAQRELATMRVLIVGLGMGSKFAEAALRAGVQHMTICDGDSVQLSNLNRQNFEYGDVATSKAKATRARLKRISPDANLTVVDKFLIKEDLERLVPDHDVIINAIDFDREEDFKHCTATVQRHGKMELFPINLGFGSALAIHDSSTPTWEKEFPDPTIPFKHQIISRLVNSENTPAYLAEAWEQYSQGEGGDRSYDPQLGVATDISSSLLTTTLVRKAKGEKLVLFPQFLYLDAKVPQIL